MKTPVRLQLLISIHENVRRPPEELDRVWHQDYVPFIVKLGERRLRAAMHITGHLLDHLAEDREKNLFELRRLAHERRLEMLGGLFYGGIPSLLPELDVHGHLHMMSEYWESFLGQAPRGFWLPELIWSPEIPRLLAGSGQRYGFITSAQIGHHQEPTRPLVVVERGERSLPAFVVDSELSAALTNGELVGWLTRVESLAHMQGELVTVWLDATRLIEADKAEPGALARFFEAFSSLTTVLPCESFDATIAARPARLAPDPSVDSWPGCAGYELGDFTFRSAAVDNLVRRMLRASGKLADTITYMEEQEREAEWGDVLANAQRLVFAAQARDPYVQGTDPEGDALRQDAMAKLIRAEELIDGLFQEGGEWLTTEEADADGDLNDEVFVSSRHLSAWVVPAEGGAIRALDDRPGAITLVSPSDARHGLAHSIRDLVLDAACGPSAVFGDKAESLLPDPAPWKVLKNSIEEDGDCAYELALTLETELREPGGKLEVAKRLRIAIDAAALSLDYVVRSQDARGAVFAITFPLHLPSPLTAVLANGDPLEQGALELCEVDDLRFECEGGALELSFEPATELWCKTHGQRVLVVPILPADGEAHTRINLAWHTRGSAAARGDQPDGGDTDAS